MLVRILVIISMMQMVLWGGAGDLDNSFGSDGKVTTEIGSNLDIARSITIQSDGKIVLVGSSTVSSDNNDFAVVRYNTDGSLDSTFNGDGKVTTDFDGNNDFAKSVTMQSNGKIILAGTNKKNGKYNFAVVRYNVDGNLDGTFNYDGRVTTAIGGATDTARGVAIQSDGKIVVAGYSDRGGYHYNFAVARYNVDGSLDGTFNYDGKVTTPIGSVSDQAKCIVIQSDGKIVVAGDSKTTSNTLFAVVRYNTDGSLDSTFANDGKATTTIGIHDQVNSVAIQSDGKILVAGRSWNGSDADFVIVRYDINGSLDSTFGIDGKVITTIGNKSEEIKSIAIQNNGKIIAAGNSHNASNIYDVAVVRYNINGSLDSTFGINGIVTTPVGNGTDYGEGVAIQNDGKIVVGGWSQDSGNWDFAVVRYIGDPVITMAPIYYLLQ